MLEAEMGLSTILIFFLCASTLVYAKHLAPQIETEYGPVQGSVSQYRGINVLEYKGIPYAKAPIGENRFLPPSKPDPWVVPIDGSEYGPMCMQQGNSTQKNESEDCLFVNVFVNERSFYGQQVLPVMAYIHGGGFLGGSGDLVGKLGPNPLAALNDIVLVSLNYRLGSLGFLFPGEDVVPDIVPNVGFRDQIFALQWIQDNIYAFKGNPSAVTIFGESAGSWSVGLHMISTSSAGLFNNAIMESGAVWLGDAQRNSTIDGSYQLIKDVGCSEKSNILACLQETDVKDLMKPIGLFENPFQPVSGDDVLPYSTSRAIQEGNFNTNKNLLVGTEKNDGAVFLALRDISLLTGTVTYDKAVDAVKFFTKNQSTDFFIDHYLKPHEHGSSDDLKQALWEFADDLIFKCPTYMLASSIANYTRETYPTIGAYVHTQKPKTSTPICMLIPNLGPCHGDDLPFVFGAPFRNPEQYNRSDDDLSRQMMEIWTYFATRYGTLPPQGPVDWPLLGPNQEANYVVELNSKNLGVMHHDKLDFCTVNWSYFLQVLDPNSYLSHPRI